jgi:actin related protein 2/3 complex subunit 2
VVYLSISIPPLCNGVLPNKVSPYTIEKVKGICPNLVEIEEPAREGFQLTLKLNLDQIPRNKGLFPLIHLQYGCHLSTQLSDNLYVLVLLGFHFVNWQSD